jgi:hypothetical protein
VRQLEHQSGADHARLLRQVDCLRLVNEVSVSDGSRDLGVRIDALAKAVESVPLSGDEPSDTLTGATGCMAAIRP